MLLEYFLGLERMSSVFPVTDSINNVAIWLMSHLAQIKTKRST